MSRTKGALNKKKSKYFKTLKKKYKKRGRPKKTKVIKEAVVYDMSKVKSYKFLGYCKKCSSLITEKEMISKTVYNCPSCNKQDKVKKLSQESNAEKFTSKKDYLQSVIHTGHVEALPNNPHQLGEKDLKIQE